MNTQKPAITLDLESTTKHLLNLWQQGRRADVVTELTEKWPAPLAAGLTAALCSFLADDDKLALSLLALGIAEHINTKRDFAEPFATPPAPPKVITAALPPGPREKDGYTHLGHVTIDLFGQSHDDWKEALDAGADALKSHGLRDETDAFTERDGRDFFSVGVTHGGKRYAADPSVWWFNVSEPEEPSNIVELRPEGPAND